MGGACSSSPARRTAWAEDGERTPSPLPLTAARLSRVTPQSTLGRRPSDRRRLSSPDDDDDMTIDDDTVHDWLEESDDDDEEIRMASAVPALTVDSAAGGGERKDDALSGAGTPPSPLSAIEDRGGRHMVVKSKRSSVIHTRKLHASRNALGQRVINGYVVVEELGRGSYGTVSRVSRAGSQFAMKVLDKRLLARARLGGGGLAREIAIMKKLKHPNIVTLLEVIDDPASRSLYLILEYAAGGPVLSTPVEPLPLATCRIYFRHVLRGLEYLHFQRIIHRDLKPDNLLVAEDGTVKISDFGISTLCDSSERELVATRGSPAFQAPEVVAGLPIGPAVDIWALGVSLFLMLFGELPFTGDSVVALYAAVQTQPLPLPSGLEPALADLLTRMLHKSAASRITLPQLLTHDWVTDAGREPMLPSKFVAVTVTDSDIRNSIVTAVARMRSLLGDLLDRARSSMAPSVAAPRLAPPTLLSGTSSLPPMPSAHDGYLSAAGAASTPSAAAAPLSPLTKGSGSDRDTVASDTSSAGRLRLTRAMTGLGPSAKPPPSPERIGLRQAVAELAKHGGSGKSLAAPRRRMTISNVDVYRRDLLPALRREMERESLEAARLRARAPLILRGDVRHEKVSLRPIRVLADHPRSSQLGAGERPHTPPLKRLPQFVMITEGFSRSHTGYSKEAIVLRGTSGGAGPAAAEPDSPGRAPPADSSTTSALSPSSAAAIAAATVAAASSALAAASIDGDSASFGSLDDADLLVVRGGSDKGSDAGGHGDAEDDDDDDDEETVLLYSAADAGCDGDVEEDALARLFDELDAKETETVELPSGPSKLPSVFSVRSGHWNRVNGVKFAAAHTRGHREHMEDRHVAIADAQLWAQLHKSARRARLTLPHGGLSFFAVYDGHNGAEAADFLHDHFHLSFFSHPDLFRAPEDALRSTAARVDSDLLHNLASRNLFCGSTAVVLAVLAPPPPPPRSLADGPPPDKPAPPPAVTLLVGNVGDSRAVLSRGGRAVAMTQDHKAVVPAERDRILAAGGWVHNRRLNGVLAVSRAFGDIEYKTLKEECWEHSFSADPLISTPDVTLVDVQPDDEFIILACDGLFDCMSSQAAVNFVRRALARHRDVSRACQELVAESLTRTKTDNVTVLLIALNQFAARDCLEAAKVDDRLVSAPSLEEVRSALHVGRRGSLAI